MDMWTIFPTTTYSFLVFGKGGIVGASVISEHPAQGVFKERNGSIVSNTNLETVDSSATMHIKSSEPFLALVSGNTVGHGVSVSKNGAASQTYRIVGQVEGYDFDTNQLSFYKVTLKPEALAETA